MQTFATARGRRSCSKCRKWNIPRNLQELIDADSPDGDGMWADDGWDPIPLTVGQALALLGAPFRYIGKLSLSPATTASRSPTSGSKIWDSNRDVYGWAKLIEGVYAKDHPEPVDELHFGDTELATCVVWAESPSTCRTLNRSRLVLIHD